MICGKIAAGKSTLTAELGQQPHTIVLSEDAWLHGLYGERMTSLRDYVRCALTLRDVMAPHIVALLRAGVSVVLDFPANTVEARAWMRNLLGQVDVEHVLHVLDVPDDVCLARLRARNGEGAHPFAVTEAQFWQVTKHFVLPMPDEGFTVRTHVYDRSAERK